jgi:hypothetical protein
VTIHKVKSWNYLFQAAKSGAKKHDFRDATERDYKIGDQLLLQEFNPATGQYTGEELLVNITYKTDRQTPCALSSNGLAQNMVVLSIEIAEANNE